MNKAEQLVSIITPCYNGESFLDRYFQSILNQTYSNLELIFINDGSVDKTEEIALGYKKELDQKGIKYIYEYQDNQGQAAALNKGLKLFTGDYITWPDSDDVMTPDCIEKKIQFLENHIEYGFCACKVETINIENPADKKNILEVHSESKEQFFRDILYLQAMFNPMAYMVRSSALLEVLPERTIYTGRGGQNAQILLPVAYKYEFGVIDEVLGYYYIREDSHSHEQKRSAQIVRQIKNYENIVLNTLKQIDESVFNQYNTDIRKYYAHLRFGNAIDSENKAVIKEEYRNLKKLRCANIKETLLYIKKII